MSRTAGPTEARVRGALLRLWDGEANEQEFSTQDVRVEMRSDGPWAPSSSIQRIGLRVAKGKAIGSIGKTGWAELDDGLEYTYSRGVFTVRCKPSIGQRSAEAKVACERLFAVQNDEGRPLMVPADHGSPNAPVVATGVRGDPTVAVHVRISLGALLYRARHVDGDVVAVHLDDLSHLCEMMGVDFEFTPDGQVIPLPLLSGDDGVEQTDDEAAGLGAPAFETLQAVAEDENDD